MSVLGHSTFSHVAAHGAREVAAKAGETLAGLLRAWRNRRQVMRLGELSDRHLADIGLVRGDLETALQAGIGVDPTVRLAMLAGGRSRGAGVREAP